MNCEPSSTICALATPTGGALAIIRISGPEAIRMACAMCPSIHEDTPANSVGYSTIRSKDGSVIDDAVVSVFKAPHSYTGEDSVELTIHGSKYIATQVINRLIDEGCRTAEPGEFTKRAYLAGKLDLSQAEAVADLISATNRATHQVALSQLRGHFSSELGQLRSQLLHLTSLIELELDFSDHEDLEFANRAELLHLANQILSRITSLAKSFETGQAIKNGIPVAIVGKTNVGKSTLLNRLLNEDRAIVSDVHGTTRDTIEDTIDIRGVTFRFIDTAGIRQTMDEVEQIGIQRTFAAIDKARIILWVIDAPPTPTEVADMQSRTEDKTLIVVQNKIDSPNNAEANASKATDRHDSGNLIALHSSLVKISAKTGQGISSLESALFEAADIPEITASDVVVSSVRHYDALTRAKESLTRVLDGLQQQLSSDLLAEDLRLTLAQLAEITGGQITPQETLNNIFSHFCVGK